MEVKIPLNDELLTTAKIMDLEKIDRSMIITTLYRCIDSLSKDLTIDSSAFKEISDAMIFFMDMTDNELTPTDTLKELMTKAIPILNNIVTANIKINEGEKALLSSTFSLMVNELIEIAGNLLTQKRPITNSLILGELEKVLVEINKQPHASVAKLNSLLYVNANRLDSLYRLLDNVLKDCINRLNQIDTMIDIIEVADGYNPLKIDTEISGLNSMVSNIKDNLVTSRFIQDRMTGADTRFTVDSTDDVILSGISEILENINKLYTVFTVDKLVRIFNWEHNDLEPYTSYNIKNNCIELKLRLDTILEIVTNSTDSLNTTIAKLKKSLPTEDLEIDDLEII